MALQRVNTTAINITWNPPDSTAYIQSYEVLLQHRNGTPIEDVILPVILNHYLAKRLTPYIPYTVFVSAINTNHISGLAVSQDFFTKEGVPLVPPRNVTLVRVNSTAVKVSWMPLTLEEARGVIIGYSVMYQTSDSRSRTVNTISVDFDASSVVISGLREEERYGVSVACRTTNGTGQASDFVYEPEIGTSSNSKFKSGYVAVVVVVVASIAIAILFAVIVIVFFKRKTRGIFRPSIHPFQIGQELEQYTNKCAFGDEIGGGLLDSEQEIETMKTSYNTDEDPYSSIISNDIPGDKTIGTYRKLDDEPHYVDIPSKTSNL